MVVKMRMSRTAKNTYIRQNQCANHPDLPTLNI